jgi:DNA-binding beta-propeller fold protein YncE
LFASITGVDQKSPNGVALLKRLNGEISLTNIFPVEGAPLGMVMTHDGKLLIVANNDHLVFMDVDRMIAGTGEAILGILKEGDSPGRIYVNVTADDRFLFVSDERARTITVINLRRARAEGFKDTAIVGKIPVGVAPIALTFSHDQRLLYTTSQAAPKSFGWPIKCKPEGVDSEKTTPQHSEGAIIAVDVERATSDPKNSVVSRVPAGCNPVRLAISPTGDRAFVTARNSNSLMAFDTSKLVTTPARALIGTVPVGKSPVGVIVVNGGKQIIVTNSNRFSSANVERQVLTVIDAARVSAGAPAVIGQIPAGAFPRELSQSPDGHTLFVSNYLSNELEVIDLDRLPLQSSKAANAKP